MLYDNSGLLASSAHIPAAAQGDNTDNNNTSIMIDQILRDEVISHNLISKDGDFLRNLFARWQSQEDCRERAGLFCRAIKIMNDVKEKISSDEGMNENLRQLIEPFIAHLEAMHKKELALVKPTCAEIATAGIGSAVTPCMAVVASLFILLASLGFVISGGKLCGPPSSDQLKDLWCFGLSGTGWDPSESGCMILFCVILIVLIEMPAQCLQLVVDLRVGHAYQLKATCLNLGRQCYLPGADSPCDHIRDLIDKST